MAALAENWASLWEAIADAQPNHTAVVVGDEVIRWRSFDDRAARLAGAFTERGVRPGDRIAELMYNCPAYLETVFAAFKTRATPVNVNYRYLADEAAHVLRDSGSTVVVFHGSLGDRLVDVHQRLPSVRLLVQVDDGTPLLRGAVWFHDLIAHEPAERIERSGDDLLFLYTGGTTGLPKGVMWRHADLFGALAYTSYVSNGLDIPVDARAVGTTAARLQESGASPVNLCAPPLMHGTALFLAMSAFVMGGSVVLLGGRRFDAGELWRLVEVHRATQISIVGDAFARPMVAALDSNGTPFDLRSVQRIVSTGATLAVEHKRDFQVAMPTATIIDMIGASEGGPFAVSVTPPGNPPAPTATFTAAATTVVLDDRGRPAVRGSGVVGPLAVTGPIPIGYHGDDAATARTFRTIDGVRYSVPGDVATIDEDGTVHFLGRGSVCINTGGEKVYPEEVEVAARRHPGLLDCTAVGAPDDRFGEVVALVAARHPGSTVTTDDVCAHLRSELAPYKVPRRVVWVDAVVRSPSGKPDYRWAKAQVST